MNTTTRLLLQKPNPDPVTGDFLDVSVLNSNFDKIDAALGAQPVTVATRPGSPFAGQIISETDTGRVYVRMGTNWRQIPMEGGRMLSNIEYERPTGGDWAISTHVSGDTQKRFILDANGMHQWGPGGGTTPDVNLYRRSANHLGTDDSFQSGGYCSGAASESVRTTSTGNITTVETVIQSLTFNAISGAGYIVDALQHVQSSVANDTVAVRLRWAAGSSVTATGTRLLTILPNCDTAGKGQPWSMRKLFIPNVTGQVTVGVTLVRDGGTGNISSTGIADRIENTITVTGA